MAQTKRSPILRKARRAALLGALSLAACATDALDLAPSVPSRPWVIPPSFDKLPPPDTSAPDHLQSRTSGTSGAAAPANPSAVAAPNATSSSEYGSAIPGGNLVAIDPNRHYDLASLIDFAQRNNPETRDAWERARQAALSVGLSEASYVPQVTGEIIAGYQHTPLPIPTNLVARGFFTADTRELLPTLTAKWLLFDFGQREGAVSAARANSFVANVTFTGAHQQLIYAVSRDYFALGAARGRLRVAQQALKSAEVVLDAADARRGRGLATTVELAQAQRQTAQARFNLVRATGAEHSAYSALIASIGIAPSARVDVTDSSDQKLPSVPARDVDEYVHDALASRPDLIAAFGKVRAAEATLRGARATYYPTIGLESQVYQNIGGLSTQGSRYYSVNEPGANVLLKLSLPLFDGGTREARIALARSEVEAAHASLDETRDTAVRQVTDAYDSLRTSFAEYSASLTLNEAAQTAYNASLDAYRHGVGTYTDVANNETALTQAQSAREDAHANVFTAAAALAFATGATLSQ
jgi:outer membrane protein TolC